MYTIKLFSAAVDFARSKLKAFDSGHDWQHTERVLGLARYIMKAEGVGDRAVVELAAVLHDIADTKFHKGAETDGGDMAFQFLTEHGLEPHRAEHVRSVINNLSFKNEFNKPKDGSQQPGSVELHIVRDADRLDAMGAIGIARAFNYGGYKNRPLYDPDVPPAEYRSAGEYKNSTAPTLNHFYEKLFLLKNLMHTKTGKKLAQERHDYMVKFVETFLREIEF